MGHLKFLSFSILCGALTFPALAGLKNSDCLECHSDRTLAVTNAAGKAVSLFVDEPKLKAKPIVTTPVSMGSP